MLINNFKYFFVVQFLGISQDSIPVLFENCMLIHLSVTLSGI